MLFSFIAIAITMATDLHSIASKVTNSIVVEAQVIASGPGRFSEKVKLKITKVGLGNKELLGSEIDAEYETRLVRSNSPQCYFSPDGRIPVGEELVAEISVQEGGLLLISVWRGTEEEKLKFAKIWVRELSDLNEARTKDDFRRLLELELLKDEKIAEQTYKHLAKYIFHDEELLKAIVDSEKKFPTKVRDVAKRRLEMIAAGNWYESDQRRSKLVDGVRAANDPQEIRRAMADFTKVVGELRPLASKQWMPSFQKIALDAENQPEENARAMMAGVKDSIATQYWPEAPNDGKLLLWGAIFQIAAETKNDLFRKVWEDMLVERTTQGQLNIKEDVLARLEDIKDPTFRDRLRDAAYTPSERFKQAPKKPE